MGYFAWISGGDNILKVGGEEVLEKCKKKKRVKGNGNEIFSF